MVSTAAKNMNLNNRKSPKLLQQQEFQISTTLIKFDLEEAKSDMTSVPRDLHVESLKNEQTQLVHHQGRKFRPWSLFLCILKYLLPNKTARKQDKHRGNKNNNGKRQWSSACKVTQQWDFKTQRQESWKDTRETSEEEAEKDNKFICFCSNQIDLK